MTQTLRSGQTICPTQIKDIFMPRDPAGNKGSFGSTGVMGGAQGMAGAVILAGRAALKTGSGKVFIGFTQPEVPVAYDPPHPEIMLQSSAELLNHHQLINAWVAGCGLGDKNEAVDALRLLLEVRGKSQLVLDADGLNAIARGALLPRWGKGDVVLTPHPAEAARLLGTDTASIQSDRSAAAQTLAAKFQCWIALKGANTIVCAPDESWQVNTTGNVGLATGGTGDVLAGMMGSLLAQGIPIDQAVMGAVWLHGAAADYLVTKGIGPIGMVAGDLLDAARDIRNKTLRS
jgi:hydroxyethylthiazole kinase-like uncharacterized protein yjeF